MGGHAENMATILKNNRILRSRYRTRHQQIYDAITQEHHQLKLTKKVITKEDCEAIKNKIRKQIKRENRNALIKTVVITLIIVLAVLALFLRNLNGQVPYRWINPLPQGNTLNAVCFGDATTVYAAGDQGTIIKSVNAGETWDILQQLTFHDLHGCFFINYKTGCVVGDSGSVFRTSDGGYSWIDVSIMNMENLLDVFLIDEQTILTCGSNGNIYRTEDSGQKWTMISSGLEIRLYSIDFPTQDTGFIVGCYSDSYIIRTINKGKTWNIIDTIDERAYSIDCLDGLTAYIAGSGGFIAKTIDGGINWEPSANPVPYYSITDIHFVSEQLGFCCSSYGDVLKTENGGETWEAIDNLVNNHLLNIHSDQDSTAVIVGNYGTIIQCKGGQEFIMRNTGSEGGLHLFSYHENKLRAIGAGAMLITYDFGLTWETDFNSEVNSCYDFQLLYPSIAYAMDYNYLYKTTNGGDSWSNIGDVPAKNISKENRYSIIIGFHMVNEQKGFIYGGGQSLGGYLWSDLYKTSNGSNFYKVDFPGPEPITDGLFIDEQLGFFLSRNLYRTINGGNSWTEIMLPRSLETRFNSIYFYDEKIGFILGYNFYNYSIVLKTEDGGLTWDICYEGNYHEFLPSQSYFSNPDNGYILGSDGRIIRTHDGGENWTLTKTITGNALNNIFPVTDSSGYLIGAGGTLIAYGEPNLSIPYNPSNETFDITIYPNPARDKFEVRSKEFGVDKIKVFDMHGLKVIDKQFYRKNKIIEIDVAKMKAGVYLCIIWTDNQHITKKLIIQ